MIHKLIRTPIHTHQLVLGSLRCPFSPPSHNLPLTHTHPTMRTWHAVEREIFSIFFPIPWICLSPLPTYTYIYIYFRASSCDPTRAYFFPLKTHAHTHEETFKSLGTRVTLSPAERECVCYSRKSGIRN